MLDVCRASAQQSFKLSIEFLKFCIRDFSGSVVVTAYDLNPAARVRILGGGLIYY